MPLLETAAAVAAPIAGRMITDHIANKRQLAAEKRAHQYELEARQYNSPANQMKLFREAGLNPELIYGQMQPFAGSPTETAAAPTSDYGEAAGQGIISANTLADSEQERDLKQAEENRRNDLHKIQVETLKRQFDKLNNEIKLQENSITISNVEAALKEAFARNSGGFDALGQSMVQAFYDENFAKHYEALSTQQQYEYMSKMIKRMLLNKDLQNKFLQFQVDHQPEDWEFDRNMKTREIQFKEQYMTDEANWRHQQQEWQNAYQMSQQEFQQYQFEVMQSWRIFLKGLYDELPDFAKPKTKRESAKKGLSVEGDYDEYIGVLYDYLREEKGWSVHRASTTPKEERLKFAYTKEFKQYAAKHGYYFED